MRSAEHLLQRVHWHRLLLLCVLLWSSMALTHEHGDQVVTGQACQTDWPAWGVFKKRFIAPQGRVIDDADERLITTSEGQSYAMFFALVNDDQPLFDKLLRWAVAHLAQGDLARHLPAWLWGRQETGQWGVLDDNSAADSDLWIAYNLLEAGRLWRVREYTLLGHQLLRLITAREVVELPGFGPLLLPGARGFTGPDQWLFNPSYLPPQLVQRMALLWPESIWPELAANTTHFLEQTAPLGIAPDWVLREGERWSFPTATEQWASYNAIRVYLWVGLLNEQAKDAKRLKNHFQQSLAFIHQDYKPFEQMEVLKGRGRGVGPVGFSAALLPLFAQGDFAQHQRTRIAQTELESLGYYGSALLLFAQGWEQGRYHFDEQGFVVPKWVDCQ